MRGNRKRDTRPELAVRSALHRRGLRFNKDFLITTSTVRVRVDVAFPRRRIAVLIDGCFWHRCPLHETEPRANATYWGPKLDRNVARDRSQEAGLRLEGWTVVRGWEHEDPVMVAERIAALLGSRRKEAADDATVEVTRVGEVPAVGSDPLEEERPS
jgi:DNA mismatch endonuclease (patch repair protein)